MLLRNADQAGGLCNRTRLQVIELRDKAIKAKILTSTHVGKITAISRMLIVPSDKRIPFRFQRRQFPIAVCFAMTINKSQGQSLANVGLFLPKLVFSHGQLYVALSRVTSKKGLKVLILNKENEITNTTKNVVFKEVLQHL
ncbi:ATP-dependent DNA helicase PIF1-like [Rutidosis leptorrhynchoides]|uniref:ATP-dependent DNA helicase PIF1-like n=1 Tax=Rutidosis leptorrhynchoides TaxID=125765 RepID=UPI003A993CDD